MTKILICFGTRPELIKLAPVYFQLIQYSDIEVKVCCSGQHYELLSQSSSQYFSFFKIDKNFELMKKGGSLEEFTGFALKEYSEYIAADKFDAVVVQGDTTTSFCAGFAAFLNKVRVFHIEAGLRTYNKYSPFPEEINRQFLSRIADLHFCPTEMSSKNLIREGIDPRKIIISGNTAIDNVCELAARFSAEEGLRDKIFVEFGVPKDKHIILVTAHRRENHGKGLQNIIENIKKISSRDDCFVLFCVHPNPNVRKVIFENLGNLPKIKVVPSQNYEQFLKLLSVSFIILTDSGGIQEEAPSFDKPVIVMRDTTERSEGVLSGNCILAPCEGYEIFEKTSQLIDNQAEYDRIAKIPNPFGDGNASHRIAETISSYLNTSKELV